ncbi:hypothetical protein BH11PAT3_BH11PAT3_0030 [soil metagenome]
MIKKVGIGLVVCSFLSLSILHVYAQTISNPVSILSSATDITTIPSVPGPNQTVTASIDSSSADLENSIITWSINGQKMRSGKGLKEFTFTNGGLGTKTTITALIQAPEGTITKTLNFNPSDVDLLTEGRGYVPPFYKGRTQWGYQTQISIVALPHILDSSGKEISAQNLIFKWSKDDTVLGTVSGIGRSSLTLSDSVLSLPMDIKLQIYTDKDTVVAEKTLSLGPVPQQTLVYEDNPLYGYMFHYAINGEYPLREKEVSFSAFPLFFSTLTKNSPLVLYDWSTNGTFGGQTTNRVTFRAPESAGTASVGIDIKHKTKFTESTSKSFGVQFGNQNNF